MFSVYGSKKSNNPAKADETNKPSDDLPDLALLKILKLCSKKDLLNFRLVSKRWHAMFHSRSLLKDFELRARFQGEHNIHVELPNIADFFGPLGYTGLTVSKPQSLLCQNLLVFSSFS